MEREEGGYPVDWFVQPNPILEKFTCAVCYNILRNPIITPCRHRFCQTCIKGVVNKCPTCRASMRLDELKEDFTAKELINEAPVKCCHSTNGCPWTGPLSNQKDHIRISCEYNNVCCKYVAKGCNQSLLRKDLEQHILNCDFRDVKCPHCGVEVSQKELEEHLVQVCEFCNVDCLNNCGAILKKKDLAQHFAKECPRAEIGCMFSPYGCTAKFPRSDQLAHNKEFTEQHLGMMCIALANTQTSGNQVGRQDKLEEENAKLREQLKSFKKSTHTVYFFGKSRLMTLPVGEIVYSPDFRAFGMKWYLTLRPTYSGSGVGPADQFGIYLHLRDAPEIPVTVKFSFTSYNLKKSYKINGPSESKFSKQEPSWGWKNVLTYNVLNGENFATLETIGIEVELEFMD